MKNNYILLLRKDDLIDLYKFGKLNAYCPSISFDGDIDKLGNDNNKAKEIFSQANPFDYSLEYYLLHVTTENKLTATKRDISVYDIQGVFAIDDSAYRFGLQLSPEVIFNHPLPEFKKEYIEFQIRIALEDAEIGVENVGTVFGRGMNSIGSTEGFITKEIKEEVIRDIYEDKPVEGEHSIWYYLLRYERHKNYPKDVRGYYLDTLHIYVNSIKGKYIDTPTTDSDTGKEIMSKFERSAKIKDMNDFFISKSSLVDKLDKEFSKTFTIHCTIFDFSLADLACVSLAGRA